MKSVSEILKACPNVKHGTCTDNAGNADDNLKFLNDRAQSVKAELAQMDIDDRRLEAEGYGQENAIASNDTEEGRAHNRRISIRVTKK